jgi:hypothetical protein
VQTTRDTQIARDLRQLGWRVETFTSDEFEDDQPLVERTVRELLGIA